jgi:hypothetical protein
LGPSLVLRLVLTMERQDRLVAGRAELTAPLASPEFPGESNVRQVGPTPSDTGPEDSSASRRRLPPAHRGSTRDGGRCRVPNHRLWTPRRQDPMPAASASLLRIEPDEQSAKRAPALSDARVTRVGASPPPHETDSVKRKLCWSAERANRDRGRSEASGWCRTPVWAARGQGARRRRCQQVKPAGPKVFARVVLVLSQMPDAEEAAALAHEAAAKLGFDATQLWIEAQYLAASRRPRQLPET